jgi:drug/metabolite transporter (DMT)-like permease
MPFLYIALGTFMWSLDTLIRYPLLGSVRPDTMVFIEHGFLVIYFLPLLFINKFNFKKLNKSAILGFVIIGMLGSAASTLAFTKAFSLINPSLVILLQKLQPLVVILLSAVLLKEKISKNFFVFGGLAFVGAFLISYPDIAPLLNYSFSDLLNLQQGLVLGYALTLFAVVGWGASTVFGKKLSSSGFSEYDIMSGRFIFGFIFLLLFCLQAKSLPTGQITIEQYLKILLMVFISGLLGMYFYYKGLKQITAHMGSIAELFFPFSAVTINWIFLGKALQPIQIAGALVLISASLMLQRSRSATAS